VLTCCAKKDELEALFGEAAMFVQPVAARQ
jgi:hypothetical protein